MTRTPGGRDTGRRLPDRWSVAGPRPAKTRRQLAKPQAPEASVARLGKGDLRSMVLDHLRAHPGEALTPSAVAKALGRSAGAVANALVKLTVEGSVIGAGERPRRFSFRGDGT